MDPTTVQVRFFQHLKSFLPPHVSMVDEVADIIDISNDSAYRRIRGEKPISLDELQKIASKYKISLDQFLHLESGSFIFSGKLADANNFTFENWLNNVLMQMQYVKSFKNKHVYFLLKDLPFYDHFQIPELAAFKYFFWRKSILHYDEMRGLRFSVKDLDPAHDAIGKKVVECYNQIPSTEIWNLESINTTIRQIEFYKDAKIFKSAEDIQCLYDKVLELINHKEMQAEHGKKFTLNQQPGQGAASYTLLVNEVILGDNTFHCELDGKKITFLNHSVINYIMTLDETFNQYIHEMLENLIRKSTQISSIGEKERTRFFNRLRDKIKLSARF